MDVITPFEDTKKQRRRRRRLRTISTFPTLLTLGNLLCGFAAIHFCLRAMFAVGADIDDAQSPVREHSPEASVSWARTSRSARF